MEILKHASLIFGNVVTFWKMTAIPIEDENILMLYLTKRGELVLERSFHPYMLFSLVSEAALQAMKIET